MVLGLAALAGPPLLLYGASLFQPRWRPSGEALAGYFFGVLAGMIALGVAR